MSLRETAAADLRAIVEDAEGFGWPITVTNPAGEALDLVGLSTDIGQTIDPETGIAVIGRKASVAITIASLEPLGGLPAHVASPALKPWRVTFNDIGGTSHEFKVMEAMPDRAIGLVTCVLEAYKP